MALDVDEAVTFAGQQPPQAVGAYYDAANVLLFTSIWPEPFGRVPVEAMLAGLPIVGSAVGGAAELLKDGETALTFPAGDARALAAQTARLLADEKLRQSLTARAGKFALERHTCAQMAAGIEAYLTCLVEDDLRS